MVQNGQLEPDADHADIRQRLYQVFDLKFRTERTPRMIKSKADSLSEQVLSNGAYKAVALVASVILWLTVLGRQEAVVTKELPLRFQMKPSVIVSYDTSVKLQVKVSGERRAIKISQIERKLSL